MWQLQGLSNEVFFKKKKRKIIMMLILSRSLFIIDLAYFFLPNQLSPEVLKI